MLPIAAGPAHGSSLQEGIIALALRSAAASLIAAAMLLCENSSTPRGRWTAILWCVLAIIMGTIPMLQGLGLLAL